MVVVVPARAEGSLVRDESGQIVIDYASNQGMKRGVDREIAGHPRHRSADRQRIHTSESA